MRMMGETFGARYGQRRRLFKTSHGELWRPVGKERHRYIPYCYNYRNLPLTPIRLSGSNNAPLEHTYLPAESAGRKLPPMTHWNNASSTPAVRPQITKANTAIARTDRTGLMSAANFVASYVATNTKAFRSQAPPVHAASMIFPAAEPSESAYGQGTKNSLRG